MKMKQSIVTVAGIAVAVAAMAPLDAAPGIPGAASSQQRSLTAGGLSMNGNDQLKSAEPALAGRETGPAQAITGVPTTDYFGWRWGGDGDEVASCIAPTSDGGFVVAGTTTSYGAGQEDVLLAKFDSGGQRLWARAFGGPAREEAHSVIETQDGHLVVVGHTESFGSGGEDLFIARFTSQGDFCWARVWGGDQDDGGMQVVEMQNGWLAVAGYSSSFHIFNHNKLLLMLFDSTATMVIYNAIGTTADWYVGRALVKTTSAPEQLIVAGVVYSGVPLQPDIVVMRFGNDASFLGGHQMRLGANDYEETQSIICTNDGGYAVAGSLGAPPDGVSTAFVAKLNSSLNGLWARTIPGGDPYWTTGERLVQASDGGLVLAGSYRREEHIPSIPPVYSRDLLLCKWSSGGACQWTRTFGEDSDEAAHELALRADGTFTLAGYTDGYDAAGTDLVIAQVSQDGYMCLPESGGPMPEVSGIGWWDVSLTGAVNTDTTTSWNIVPVQIPLVSTCICPQTWVVCPDGSGDFSTIQEALDAACDGSTILLCDGIFSGDGNVGLDYLGKAVTVRSLSGDPAACIIDCNDAYAPLGSIGVSFHSYEGRGSVLSGVTIRDGSMSIYPLRGGAIACANNASPTIEHCIVTENSATYGGGIYCAAGCAPAVIDCAISGNHAAVDGGGVYAEGNAALTNCTISDNQASFSGGGIYGATGCTPAITGCAVYGNHATDGAGMLIVTNAHVANCTISNNDASGQGGGIYGPCTAIDSTICDNSAANGGGIHCASASGALSLTTCVVCGNAAAGSGGALYAYNCAPVLQECTVCGNSAVTDGGGLYCNSAPAAVALDGCVISGNRAGGSGGGLRLTSAALQIVASTMAANSAGDSGGGIRQSGNVTMDNCIIWGNGAPDHKNWRCEAGSIHNCCTDYEGETADLDTPMCYWLSCPEGQESFAADPAFCEPARWQDAPTCAGDFQIEWYSPCAPWQHPSCGLIGALGATSVPPILLSRPWDPDALRPWSDHVNGGPHSWPRPARRDEPAPIEPDPAGPHAQPGR